MAQGIGEVLTFATGVAIKPVPIITVILTVFVGVGSLMIAAAKRWLAVHLIGRGHPALDLTASP